MSFIQFTKRGIYCKVGKFYLDPWLPVDYAIISHGHADHARWGMKHYLCHEHSENILKYRIGQDISIESMPYNEKRIINGVTVSFHPAGHLIGSAQIRLEYKGEVVVFTGDYKVKNDNLTIPFEPVKCHTLITESTFGLPIYKWQSEAKLQEQLQHWIGQNQQAGKTSVLFGYSLGKAQRLLKLVEDVDDIYVHRAIYNTNQVIEQAGIALPHYQLLDGYFDKKEIDQKILVLPPALLDSKMMKRIPNPATAICSGWMQVRGNRRWRGVDAGFAISDHADWEGLLQAIRSSEAEQVYVTHGYQASLTKYLNQIGISASELITDYGVEQMSELENQSA